MQNLEKPPALTTSLDASWFLTHRIGYGSPRPEVQELRALMNNALLLINEKPLPMAESFTEQDSLALRKIQSSFSIDRKTGEVVRITDDTTEKGIPASGVCGLPTIQVLLKLGGLEAKSLSHLTFIKRTAGRWDLSHLEKDQPAWLASDYPLTPPLRSGQVLAPFRKEVAQIGKMFGLSEEDVVRLILFESGGDPAAKNFAGARGYIQFMPPALQDLAKRGLPFTAEPLRQLKLVGAYLSGVTRGKSAAVSEFVDLYVAILGPAFLRSETLYSSTNRTQARHYNANRWLDVDGDGTISREDLKRVLGLYWFQEKSR